MLPLAHMVTCSKDSIIKRTWEWWRPAHNVYIFHWIKHFLTLLCKFCLNNEFSSQFLFSKVSKDKLLLLETAFDNCPEEWNWQIWVVLVVVICLSAVVYGIPMCSHVNRLAVPGMSDKILTFTDNIFLWCAGCLHIMTIRAGRTASWRWDTMATYNNNSTQKF